MFFDSSLTLQVTKILEKLRVKKLKIATAESCTGGLLSALFTSIAGASNVFERGFITYSNEAKIEMLGVKKSSLEKFGAVSAQVAREMAAGALKNSGADIAIAITGIAGPKSDDTKKPVGLVYIALAVKNKIEVKEFNFSGSRGQIRESSVAAAIDLVVLAEKIL
jgi:nicotinamide-nucleotide amidase